MNNLAIIPARSGSKGLKDKNITELCGKPLLAYSIDAALESKLFSHVMVSTDSEYYSNIAKTCGAEVPFLRNSENASDTASSWDVVKEVLANYKSLGIEFDTVTLLQPTSPLRNADDIIKAYSIYFEKSATAVVSVCEAEHSPLLCNVLPPFSHSMDGFISAANNTRRQALGTYYRLNGAVYIVDVKHLLSGNNIYDSGCYAYIMPASRSVDIDNMLDFKIAETVLNNKDILNC